MGQGVFDFFAAAGFGISGLLLSGMNLNFNWLWMVLAAGGLIWSIGIAGIDDEGVVAFLKQLACVLISAIIIFGPLKVDLAPYSYVAPGKLEALLGRTQGSAVLPTYPIFRVGRAMMMDGRSLLSKGKTTSIPNIVMQADLMTTDPEVLDDKELKANLAIWNQIVAPYILKQDPTIEAALGQAGLLSTFMVPVPTSRDFVGAAGDRATKVRDILAGSKVGVADMLCTLQSYIESTAGRMGGTMWTSENGTCIDPNIRLRVASAPKSASSMPTIFSRPPQAAWDQGRALIAAMISASAVDSNVQTVATLGQLYEKIGQATLYVAASNYAADSDKVVVLGTACDKMATTNEPNACAILQSGLVSAAGGLSSSAGPLVQPAAQGFWDSVTGGMAFALGWVTTSIFRILIALLSAMTVTVIPYAIGIGITCSLLLSAIGPYVLLWPRRFTTAVEWMIGPVLFVCLWGMLHNIWTEIDTWIMLLVGQIGAVISEDRMMGKNVAGIICSLGYLGMPFLAYTILFGRVGQAIAKTTGLASSMVKTGAFVSLFMARMAAQAGSGAGGAGSGGSSGGGGGAGGGGSSGGGSAPPSSSPAGSVGGPGSQGGRSSGGATPTPQGGNSASPPQSGGAGSAQGGSASGSSSGGSAPPGSGSAGSPSSPPPSNGYGGAMRSGQSGYGASVPASQPPGPPKFQPLP